MSELFSCLVVLMMTIQFLHAGGVMAKKMVKKVTKNPINIVISDIHSDGWKIGSFSLISPFVCSPR